MDEQTTKKEWEKEKIELEQDLFELQSRLDDARKQLGESTRTIGELRQHLEKTESDRNERVRRLFELEAARDSLESEKAHLRRACENLSTDKDSLVKILDDRSEEVTKLQDEIRGLKTELKSLTLEKCHQQIKADDLTSRELLLEHREKRWAQERELIMKEKEWYYNEMAQRDQQIQQLRKESSSKILTLQAELDKVVNENYGLESSITNLKEENDNLSVASDELNKKFKEAMDSKSEMEAMYERELLTQMKLVQLYKDNAEEAEKKVDELTKTMENNLLSFDEAKSAHVKIEQEMKMMKSEHIREITEKEKEIADYKDELEKANELLRSKHRVTLSDEEIATLSPAAAAASKLIKSGHTLTQIYREHMKVLEEMQEQRLAYKQLEESFRELVQDIAQKAPIIREQQEEYHKTLDVLDNLKAQLDAVGRELDRQTLDKEACNRQLVYTKNELEKCQRENIDLSAQVRELVLCVEKIRQNDYSVTGVRTFEGNSNDHSFLFRNIDELLSQNQRLKAALHDAESKRDEMIKAARDAEMSKMKNELQMAMQELEDVKNFREKQDKLLQAVTEQRDSYERMYQEKLQASKDGAGQSAEAAKIAQELNGLKLVYEKLNTEFDVYREQKGGLSKFLNEKIDRLQQELTDSRAINAKLNAEVQYHMERFKIAHSNIEGYQNEIKSLRERNEKYSGAVARQEQRAADLTAELMKNCEESAKLKVEKDRLQESLRQAQSNENRLDQELQMFRRSSLSQNMLTATLQDLQSRLERAEVEQTLKLKLDVDSLTKERNNLQETVKNLNEKCEKYANDHCAKIADYESKLDEEKRKSSRLESQLAWTNEQLKIAEEKMNSLQKDLTLSRSSSEDSTAERYQKESQQLQTRLNYLEIRFSESNKKVGELTEKLSRSEKQLDQFRNLSSSLETGLADQKKFVETEKVQLLSKIAECEKELIQLRQDNQNLEDELRSVSEQLVAANLQAEQNRAELWPQIQQLESALYAARAELETWKAKERDWQADLQKEMAVSAEYREKFNQESESNKENESMIEALKEKLEITSTNLLTAESKIASMQSDLNNHNAIVKSIEERYKNETTMLQERVTALIRHNNGLLEQIDNLGNSLSVLESVRQSTGTNLSSAAVEGAQKDSCESLMQVIKCLRDERQRIAEKLDQAETEQLRLKSRESLLQNDMARLSADLQAAQKEAAALPEMVVQKGQLLAKLEHFNNAQEANKILNDEKLALEKLIGQLEANIVELNDRISELSRDKHNLERSMEQARKNLEAAQKENFDWQKRHDELIQSRAKFEEEEMNKLRSELSGSLQKLTACNLKIESLTNENSSIKAQLDTAQEERNLFNSKLIDVSTNYENLKIEYDSNKKTLNAARQVAVKYKKQCDTYASTENEKNDEISMLKNDLEKLRTTQQTAEAQKSAAEELAKYEKEIADLKNLLVENDKKLLEFENERKELQECITRLEEQKKIVEQNFEEQRFRLDLITNKHNKLNEQMKTLTEQMESGKSAAMSREKILSLDQGPSKVVMSKPAPIQAVPAMPSVTNADRPGSSGVASNQETGRRVISLRGSTRLTPTIASVRPMAPATRTTLAVLPTAISPSPAMPDQSSAMPTTFTPQTASNVVSTSTANQQQSSTAFTVPQAVVFPNVDFPQSISDTDVTESSDAELQGAISSSNAAMVSAESSAPAGEGESSAATSAAFQQQQEPPSTSSKRRHSFLETIDVSKRSRAASPEQVSTSDQSTSSAMIVPVLVAPQNDDSGLEEPAEMVGSSLDDEVVIVEEREVESSGGHEGSSYGERLSSGAIRSLGSGDSRQLTAGWSGTGFGVIRGDDFGDDGIVPSTPTFTTTRSYMESDISAAHVPQSRTGGQFTFAPGSANLEAFAALQSHSFGDPTVPTTPRGASPHDLGVFVSENEAASSSTMANVLDQENSSASDTPVELMQQPQPSGQGEEVDVDVELGTGEAIESTGMSSEAVAAATQEGPLKRLRKVPITWSSEEEGQAGPSSSAADQSAGSRASSSGPTTLMGSSGTAIRGVRGAQTARRGSSTGRGRRARGGRARTRS